MFPSNSTTLTGYLDANAEVNLVEAIENLNVIVYAVSFTKQSAQNDITAYCNTSPIYTIIDSGFRQEFTHYYCDNSLLYIDNNSNQQAWYAVTFATGTDPVIPVDIYSENGISYGEMITGVFLLLIFTILFFGGIWNSVMGVKKKRNSFNTFLYNSPEGKGEYID